MKPIALAVAAAVLSPTVIRAQSHTFVLPYVGSAPETGFQYGATAFRIEQPADTSTRPSSYQVFASYTVKSQARAFLDADRWSSHNTWRTTAHLEWERFPLPYYGTGDDTPESAEEIYTPRGTIAALTVQRRIAGPFYAFLGYRWQDLRIVETEPNGALRGGVPTASRGARIGQLVAGEQWDTRDDVFAPEHGTFAQITVAEAHRAFGSQYDFQRVILDARRFASLGGGRVLAVQAVLEGTGGTAPFDQLSLVGSSSYMRGYARGRFRDRQLAMVQGEYRAPLWRKWRWAAFGGGGRIAPTLESLAHGDARFLPTYGVGVRRQLFASSRSAIRLDYGRGASGQSGLYVALNEAF